MFILPDRICLSLFWLAPATRVFPVQLVPIFRGGPNDRPGPPVFFCRLCLGKLKVEFRISSLNSAFFVPKIGVCVWGMEVAMSFFYIYTQVVFGYPLCRERAHITYPHQTGRKGHHHHRLETNYLWEEGEIPGMISWTWPGLAYSVSQAPLEPGCLMHHYQSSETKLQGKIQVDRCQMPVAHVFGFRFQVEE